MVLPNVLGVVRYANMIVQHWKVDQVVAKRIYNNRIFRSDGAIVTEAYYYIIALRIGAVTRWVLAAAMRPRRYIVDTLWLY